MIDPTDHVGLSRPGTKAGRLQRACLLLMYEHERDGAIPTSGRFVFYELEGRGIIPKTYPGKRQPGTDVSEALTVLRELGKVPWSYLVDETRSLETYLYADTIKQGVLDDLERQRIDLWAGKSPPVILCESRSLKGVLRSIAAKYLCPIASTNGQTGGFLHTDIAPLLAEQDEPRVLYLGDLDKGGEDIEANTRRVLATYVWDPDEALADLLGPMADLTTPDMLAELGLRPGMSWERLAITDVQVREHDLTVIDKLDRRYKPPQAFPAVETEALSQRVIQRILTEHLDDMLPEPLEDVFEREDAERVQVREMLEREEED